MCEVTMWRRRVLAALVAMLALGGRAAWAQEWMFAVSGDSRNCGDVVMPAIAAGVIQDGAKFYWHLGDFRAMYAVDDDYKGAPKVVGLVPYQHHAWDDFIHQQLGPFGKLPVYLVRGNHEQVGKSRDDYVEKFTPWLDQAAIREQRQKDGAGEASVQSYYHWIQGGVDFITLDNASGSSFDTAQMAWLKGVLERASKNSEVKSVVVGMHAALPDSLSAGHSMNESPEGTNSGREAYRELAEFRKQTNKPVYVLASHSHFYMTDVYKTACRIEKGQDVLPGWIVGTAGAVRYRLPEEYSTAATAMTDVYGYLLGHVAEDGSVRFEFKQIREEDVTAATSERYKRELIHHCFVENRSNSVPAGAPKPPKCP